MTIEQIISSSSASIKLEITPDDLMKIVEHATQTAVEKALTFFEQKQQEGMITRKEAMQMLHVNTHLTMQRWEAKGYLKPHRMSNRIYYSRSEVLAAMEQFERDRFN